MARGSFEQWRAKVMRNQNEWGDPISTIAISPLIGQSAGTEDGAQCSSCSFTPMNRRVEKSKAPNPILTSKGWTLEVLLGRGKRFLPAPRISVLQDDLNDCISFYENSGIPFVVENLHHLPGWANDFVNIDWLENSSEITNIPARNIRTACDVLLSLSEFIEKSRNSSVYYQEGETERLYGKDLYLPEEWTNWLKTANVVPEQFLPDSDNLLTHLPESAKVETLMCYIGTGDTFTPSHKDLCSSHGHNLMCYTENGGSSFWFMTKRADARTVADYFHTKFGHEIDHESHITTVDDFADAPFDVYIVEQKLGDLVLVPRMSCHQVVNSGGLTVKLSWSRMTMKSIEQAIYYELPLYHRVCRPEIYRVRLTLYHTIKMYHAQFEDFTYTGDKKLEASRRLGVLLRTFDHVLKNECTKDYTSLPCLAPSGQETDALSCDFCGCDIFQSYFECISCTSSVEGDFCTICPDCYAEGRSCHCRLMQPKQVQPLDDVLQERAGTIEVLQSYWKSINEKGVSFASRNSLFAGGAFEAGCYLAKSRQQKDQKRVCSRSRSEHTHEVNHNDVVTCKHCHRSSCYAHLLTESKLHSVDILLDRQRDTERTLVSHHERHLLGKKEYDRQLPTYLDEESKGDKAPSSLETQRASLALNFDRCRPYNPSITQAGWYDSIIVAPVHVPPAGSPPPPYVAEAPVSTSASSSAAQTRSRNGVAGPSTNPDPRSARRVNATTTLSGAETSAQASSSKPPAKKRKMVMDCVFIQPPSSRPTQIQNRIGSPIENDVIELSSDSGSDDSHQQSSPPSTALVSRNIARPPPLNRRISSATSTTKSKNTERRRASALSRPARPVQPSEFPNDLASVITAAAFREQQEEVNEPISASASSKPSRLASSARPANASSLKMVPKKAKKPSARPSNSSSVSWGKRRQIDSDSEAEISEEDEAPIVATPQMPSSPPKPQTKSRRIEPRPFSLGRSDPHGLDTARARPATASFPSTLQEGRTSPAGLPTTAAGAGTGTKPRAVPPKDIVAPKPQAVPSKETTETNPPVSSSSSVIISGANVAKGSRPKAALPKFRKRKEPESSEDQIAESSRAGALRSKPTADVRKQRPVSERPEHDERLFRSGDARATIPMDLTSQLSEFLTTIKAAQSENALSEILTAFNNVQSQNTDLRARNTELTNRVTQLEQHMLETTRQQNQAGLQQSSDSSIVNYLNYVPAIIQNAVDNSIQQTFNNILRPQAAVMNHPAPVAPVEHGAYYPNQRRYDHTRMPPRGPSNSYAYHPRERQYRKPYYKANYRGQNQSPRSRTRARSYDPHPRPRGESSGGRMSSSRDPLVNREDASERGRRYMDVGDDDRGDNRRDSHDSDNDAPMSDNAQQWEDNYEQNDDRARTPPPPEGPVSRNQPPHSQESNQSSNRFPPGDVTDNPWTKEKEN